MERIRETDNHWWEYYCQNDGAFAHWHLHFCHHGRYPTEHVAQITRFPLQYTYGIDYTVKIPGHNFKDGWRDEPLETPLDDLMERIESEYGQYLEIVRDYYAALVDDFGYGLPF